MRATPWLRAALAGAFALAAAALPAGAQAPLPVATSSPWLEVKTTRFEISTQGEEAQAWKVARHLERLAEALEKTTTGFLVDGGRKMRVLIFKDRVAFLPYCPIRDDHFGNTAGWHTTGVDAEYLTVYGTGDDQVLEFVAHEYLHAVIARSFGEVPLWLNEGLAEFYRTFQPRRRSVEIGRPPIEHVEWLRRHTLPVRQILALSGESPDYRGGERRATVYAESWALVHMLAFDEDGGRRLGRLIHRLARGEDAEAALVALYGRGVIDSLDRELRARVARTALPFLESQFATSIDDLAVRSRPLERAEVLARLGEMLASAPDSMHGKARAHLVAAWRADSTRTMAAAVLAAMAERAGDDAEASRWTDRVARGGDARALGMAGDALARRRLRRVSSWGGPPTGPAAPALRARELLDRAVAGDPATREWLIPYGLTFLDDTAGVARAVGALLEAQETWPRRTEITGALAILSVRAGQPGNGLRLHRSLPDGREREYWRDVTSAVLVQDAQTRAVARVHAGRYAEAESIMARLQIGLEEPRGRAQCDRVIDWARDAAKVRGGRAAAAPAASAGETGGATAPSAPKPPPSRGGSSPAAAESRRAYTKAMTTGAYADAENAAVAMRKSAATPREKARADSLAAEARSRKALESAEALLRFGNSARACEMIRAVLADRPTGATRREAERLQGRSCR